MWSTFSLVALIVLVGSVNCFPEGRVVNGTDTDITKYPFIVSLRDANGSHFCGCSIIAQRWVLTAAHCVNRRLASQLSIQYGTTIINDNIENVVAVKRIIVHEHYTPSRALANDIALLELQRELAYNYKTIAPVTLPDPYFEVPQTQQGVPGSLAGWGLNATGGDIQIILQKVDLKIYSDAECNSRHNGGISDDQICAGADEGGKGQCTADSGGPLVTGGSTQLGIVSWSIKPCAVAPVPGVYTKVSHYIDWIDQHIH